MFLVSYTYRTASSGSESRNDKVFDTLEEAAKYIRTEWYDSFCEINEYPDEWDEENLGRSMPTRNDFSIEAIKNIIFSKFKPTLLFGPYDKYCGLVQNELHLKEVNKA